MEQVLESAGPSVQQKLIDQRKRFATARGMVEILNNGYPKGKIIFYPKHQMRLEMPEPGGTMVVPREVGEWLIRVYNKKLQYVHAGQAPANYTPPPGYRLVPTETLETPDEKDLLIDPEKE